MQGQFSCEYDAVIIHFQKGVQRQSNVVLFLLHKRSLRFTKTESKTVSCNSKEFVLREKRINLHIGLSYDVIFFLALFLSKFFLKWQKKGMNRAGKCRFSACIYIMVTTDLT